MMDDRKQPRISVVMATYNGEAYIGEQIDSILKQTYPVYELIIQDDGSTDSTFAIISDYAGRHGNIHVFRNKENLGYSKNFMTATMRATGDYIALSDQDDVWYPEKLEKQIKQIGQCDVCYSQHHTGQDMEHLRLVSYKCAPERQLFHGIVGHSLLMRREYAQDESNWITSMYHDMGLALFGHFSNGVTKVDEPLDWHRSHSKQASRRSPFNQSRPTWQPYVFGFFHYKRMKKNPNFRIFYEKAEEKSRGINNLANTICRLLLSDSPLALLKLCVICMKHRDTIYPSAATGIKGRIRSFFFPFIHSYNCNIYDL